MPTDLSDIQVDILAAMSLTSERPPTYLSEYEQERMAASLLLLATEVGRLRMLELQSSPEFTEAADRFVDTLITEWSSRSEPLDGSTMEAARMAFKSRLERDAKEIQRLTAELEDARADRLERDLLD